jgi:hypothetical protein
MNTFEFLKNYKDFANHIRYITSEALFAELKESQNVEFQKTLMLRLIEELVASTEDLAMWLVALYSRHDENRKYRDEWERILSLEITQQDSTKLFYDFKKVKTTKGFLKKMDFPSIEQLSKKLGRNENLVIDAVDTILRTIASAIATRSENNNIALRAHNKIKHGMMVYSDFDRQTLWIRDFSVKELRATKRLSRKDRSFNIPLDVEKAELMVGTIKSYSYGIEALINLLLIDYEYRFTTGKIRVWQKNKQKCLTEISKALQ